MKNTLLNMILVLGTITLVASAGVGLVYKVTEEPIRMAKEANTKLALGDVVPEFDTSQAAEMQLDGIDMVVYTAKKGGRTVGYAVQTATKKGFSGEFKLMVGFTPDGKVYNVKVLEHAETPGLGDKMAAEGNPLLVSFEGKNPSQMKLAVVKDGGDVDALTAATITSRAYVDAVARAFNALMRTTGGQGVEADVDAGSGATAVDGESGATTVDGESGATPVDGESGATKAGGEPGATAAGGKPGATKVDGESGATAGGETGSADNAVSAPANTTGNANAGDVTGSEAANKKEGGRK